MVSRLLMVGRLGTSEEKAISVVAEQLGLGLETAGTSEEGLRNLDGEPFEAVLVDLTLKNANRVFTRARSRRGTRCAPVIALTRAVSDLRFTRALQWGADDLVLWRTIPELAARLRAVFQGKRDAKLRPRGEALVADPSTRRCEVLGSVLTAAGYEVKHAVDLMTLEYYLSRPTLRLAVVSGSFPDVKSHIQRAREAGNEALCIVTEEPSRVLDCIEGLRGLRSVVAIDSQGPPDNVLFVANEAELRKGPNARTKRRMIYAKMAAFREEGAASDDYGFTYTASEEGLFVRTLHIPEGDRIWIDVRPPDGNRLVRLLAQVAWRRPMGSPDVPLSPPGFGVKLIAGLGDDLTIWSRACATAVTSRIGGNPIWIESLPPPAVAAGDRLNQLIQASLEDVEDWELFDRDSTVDSTIVRVESLSPSNPNSTDGPEKANATAPGSTEVMAEPAPPNVTPPIDPPGRVEPGANPASKIDAGPVAPVSRDATPASPARSGGTRSRRYAAYGAAALVAAFATGGLVLGAQKGAIVPPAPARVNAPRPAAPAPARPVPPPPAPVRPAAAPGSAAPPSGAPTVDAPPNADALAPTQGYLRIETAERVPVSVHGAAVGMTNEWLAVRCGPRFVRLGTPEHWLDAGSMEVVPCRKHVSLARPLVGR